ncbi:hypothetical protein CBR_g37259 [Chara braunii]|uniref:Integrase catalytic domain-containing protein n=1 Tax=Chara braunii TaxID=69332 RepID=A0A388LMT4_CHABU|nr:hypothetical protein CBR_g37259 [Chara braunii]|eukprot:GBG83543.1 hypothetical protein CBR_g37259 [Chara braunii]
MDQRSREADEAYQARMLAWSTETKKWADDAAAAAKKKAEDAEQARLLALEQQRQHDEAPARAADEERNQRREKIFSGEQTLLTMAAAWRPEAENGKLEDCENKITLLLSHLTDLLATCITQQEDIHSLDDSLPQVQGRLQQQEQRPVAAPDANSSNTSDRLEALEMDVGSLKDGVQLQQTATQQLQQRICTTANTSSSEPRETTPKFDGQEIFSDSMKTDPIPWFRKFELTLQLHMVKEHKHHAYLYSCSGGACQAWLDNLLSKYGVVANDLHTKISWDDLKAAWHKRFQVEPPKTKAMDKLMVFEQGTLPSTDLIAEYQYLTSVPDIQMDFKAIRHYFISRSCPALSNALTHVKDTLTTTTELFDKVVQIIITNKEAKNLRSSAEGPSRDQHRPRVAVVAATTPLDQTSEAVSAYEGDRLADSAREFNIEVLDPLTSEDFAWLPLPTTGRLPGPQCAALCAHLHTYLSFYAPPTSPTDDEVAVGDILAYTTKVAREFRTQRYDDNNAPPMYVCIQVGQASCSALLDSGASRNFMNQSFMQRAGLGAQVRRKANPMAIKLADGKMQQLPDRYIEAVPYFSKKVFVVHSIDDARKKELLVFVHYRIKEGYLLVHTQGKDLLCVPSDPHLRTRLLGEFHDAPATGHFGVNRTIGRLRERFWWPGLLGNVTRYCESCEVCRCCKSRNHRPYGELRPLSVPLRRREAIAMDITGPFPKHKTGVDGILPVVDRLTKFAMFSPCRYHAKALELAEVLYAGWIRTKGYPKEIVWDRDTRFMSDFWLALIKRWGSSLKPNSARHPQTDGQTERVHQTAQVLLRTLIRPDQKDWVEQLPDVELAYNSFIHPTIGVSPFEFEHGSPVTSPLNTITPRTVESDDHLLFLRRMQELLVKARDQMAKTQQRMSAQANRQRLPCPFHVDDLVWVSTAEFQP